MSLSIKELNIYPVKSLAGISLQEAMVTDRGLQHDRRWVLVSDDNVFLSQRNHARMALLKPEIVGDRLRITSREGGAVEIPLEPNGGDEVRIEVWDDTCEGMVMSAVVNHWFSSQLGQACRLVYMPDRSRRKVDPRYARDGEVVSFADGYPFLILSEASLDGLNQRLTTPVPINRFRANIIIDGARAHEEDDWKEFLVNGIQFFGVKPCARCQVVTIDQENALASKEPLATLSQYRREGNKVLFGMNLLHKGQGSLRQGDMLRVTSRFSR
ncbi:MAG: MOSC domain-containing protein [Bacteroidia bacterium]|nr:MOSC domain-containing protein [Bacteroidia bacterium]